MCYDRMREEGIEGEQLTLVRCAREGGLKVSRIRGEAAEDVNSQLTGVQNPWGRTRIRAGNARTSSNT